MLIYKFSNYDFNPVTLVVRDIKLDQIIQPRLIPRTKRYPNEDVKPSGYVYETITTYFLHADTDKGNRHRYAKLRYIQMLCGVLGPNYDLSKQGKADRIARYKIENEIRFQQWEDAKKIQDELELTVEWQQKERARKDKQNQKSREYKARKHLKTLLALTTINNQ